MLGKCSANRGFYRLTLRGKESTALQKTAYKSRKYRESQKKLRQENSVSIGWKKSLRHSRLGGGGGAEGDVLCPQSNSPQLRKQDSHGNANTEREFIASSSQGPGYIQHSGIKPEPRALCYRSIYRFRTKTGNWQGWIGYKGFFASTNWLDFSAHGLS